MIADGEVGKGLEVVVHGVHVRMRKMRAEHILREKHLLKYDIDLSGDLKRRQSQLHSL